VGDIDERGTALSEPLIAARRLEKSFGRTQALRGVSISVSAGEVVAVTGPSGSGKSTLLLCLAGVLQPDAGEVTFDGRRLSELSETERTTVRRREFGLVLQFGQLVPELTAAQNVALPLLLDGADTKPAHEVAVSWLERLGVAELATALPGELSGGELQRVAVARALVTRPKVIFADEPTGALDTVNGAQVLSILLSTAREQGATVVLVTHDNRVAAHADREVVLRDGEVELVPDSTEVMPS
jgi:putative ABC transport system ATP-binding protein